MGYRSVPRCPLPAARGPARRPLPAARCPPSPTRYPLPAARCPLPAARDPVPAVTRSTLWTATVDCHCRLQHPHLPAPAPCPARTRPVPAPCPPRSRCPVPGARWQLPGARSTVPVALSVALPKELRCPCAPRELRGARAFPVDCTLFAPAPRMMKVSVEAHWEWQSASHTLRMRHSEWKKQLGRPM
jgi:hypothetical protein